jgi:UrcA family protein
MSPFHQIDLRPLALLVISTLFSAESGVAVAHVDEAPSVTVRYHDLDLNSPEGVTNLYERIHAAALVVCKSTEGSQFVSRVFWTEWNACINHAEANAVDTVHNQKLSAYRRERSRGWKLRSVPTLMSAARH